MKEDKKMRRRLLWVTVGLLAAAAMVLSSCTSAPSEGTATTTTTTTGTTSTAATTTTTTAADEGPDMMRNVWGELVETPQYGGKITIVGGVYLHTDPWYNWQGTYTVAPVLEKLGIGDFGLTREEFDFTSHYVPLSVIKPNLAESYRQPDPLTIVFNIRQGIYWDDKAPVNGRQFDAYDVEISLKRVVGLDEWEEQGPSPFAHLVTSSPIISVEATDKWTVVVKSSAFSLLTLDAIYWESWEGSWISPRELLENGGDHRDWRTLVGTGPFRLTDHVDGSSWTYTRNPNYWATDERHPGMALPFIDELKVLMIPDEATRNAALRSGKIDVQGGYTVDKAQVIEESNPELIKVTFPGGGFNQDSAMLVTQPPFDDLRVRQAMQKAINLEEMAQDYYKGYATSVPFGIGGPAVIKAGYDVGWDDWPEEVKEGYRYDPARAIELLTDAGYPNGFTFTYDIWVSSDVDRAQLFKAYWAEIGVTAVINAMDNSASVLGLAYAHDFEMTLPGYRGNNYTPFGRVNSHETGSTENFSGWSDAEYDALADAVYASATAEEFAETVKAASVKFASAQIMLAINYPDGIAFAQPWIKGGWWGQAVMGGGMIWTIYSRFWVDQEMKKAMGH